MLYMREGRGTGRGGSGLWVGVGFEGLLAFTEVIWFKKNKEACLIKTGI